MRRLWLTILLLLSSPAWSQTLVASVEPLAKVLRGLYGDQVQVETLLQANQNPHQLALSPRQAMLVQQADLLVWLGETVEAPLAPLVARRQGPTLALLELEGVHRREGGMIMTTPTMMRTTATPPWTRTCGCRWTTCCCWPGRWHSVTRRG